MSALPGTSVNFEFTGTASGLDRVTRDAEKRVAQMARAVNATKIEATPRIDIGRLERDAQRSKEILRGIQEEADRLAARRTAGGLTPTGAGPMGGGGGPGGGSSGGGGGDDAVISRYIRLGSIVRAVTATLEASAAAMDEHYANQSGNLERILAAEQKRSQVLRSIPFAGPLGGAIADVIQSKDRAAIADTMESAAAGNQKADFMERQNARRRAEQQGIGSLRIAGMSDRGASGTEIELARVQQQIQATPAGDLRKALEQRATELAAKAAAEREDLEREHQRKMLSIQREGEVARLEEQGKESEARRAKLIAGFKDEEEALAGRAERAETAGDTAGAGRIRQQLQAERQRHEQEARAFDAQQEQKELDRRGKQDSDFEERKRKAEEADEKRTAEGRERGRRELVRDLEGQIREAEHAQRGQSGRAVSNALLTATSAIGGDRRDEATQHLKDMKELLKRILDKDYPSQTT